VTHSMTLAGPNPLGIDQLEYRDGDRRGRSSERTRVGSTRSVLLDAQTGMSRGSWGSADLTSDIKRRAETVSRSIGDLQKCAVCRGSIQLPGAYGRHFGKRNRSLDSGFAPGFLDDAKAELSAFPNRLLIRCNRCATVHRGGDGMWQVETDFLPASTAQDVQDVSSTIFEREHRERPEHRCQACHAKIRLTFALQPNHSVKTRCPGCGRIYEVLRRPVDGLGDALARLARFGDASGDSASDLPEDFEWTLPL